MRFVPMVAPVLLLAAATCHRADDAPKVSRIVDRMSLRFDPKGVA
jgi:hypothetical protein